MDDKKPRIPTENDLASLRTQIEEGTTHLLNSKGLQEGALLGEVKALYPTFNKTKLRNLRNTQLIRPPRGENNYHNYSVDDLRDILLVLALKDEGGPWRLSYAEIFGSLLQSLRSQLQETQNAAKSIEVRVGQNQRERGFYIWRSSMVRYFLLYLFEGKLPPDTFAFLYAPRHSILEPGDGDAPWLRVKPCEFGDVDYLLKGHNRIFKTSDNDVLHWPSRTIPQPYERGATWYHIEGGGRTYPPDYQIILAVPDSRRQCSLSDETNVGLLLRLIDGCFLDDSDIGSNNHPTLTALDVVNSLIPRMSPAWQYAVCLASDAGTPDHLISRSASKLFAVDGRKEVQIGFGQLLSGRAYQEGYPIVVQRAMADSDPRIAEGWRGGAAAVPTLYNGKPNGALYVTARTDPAPNEPFSGTDVALLRILGLIAGQLLGQDEALAQSGRMSLAIINDPTPTGLAWDELPAALAEALKEVKPSDAALSKNSIHLVAVQVKTYDELEAVAPDIATWAIEQLYASAVRYFTRDGIAPPKIYIHSSREFLLLLPRVDSSDEADRQMREKLRQRLNSLSLTLPAKGQLVKVECELWSLPFRYTELLRTGDDPEKQVNNMITAAEEAFVFLPYVYQAHQYERDGAWHAALGQYSLASRLAPNNQYLRRHMAKALTQLQRHPEAISRWSQMLARQKHPSHYRRLAHNLVALGTEDGVVQAIEAIQEAIALDERDAKNHAVAGSIYAIAGQPEEAIAELELAAAYDPANAARYQLHIADIHYDQGCYAEALGACIVAHTHDADDRDIPAMMMRVAWAMNRPTAPSL